MSIPAMPVGRTLIRDLDANESLLWIDTQLVLPIGSIVQLGEPNRDYRVVKIRLLAGPDVADVVLEVELLPPGSGG